MRKFSSRKSLVLGIGASIWLSSVGWTLVTDGRWLVGLFQVVIGLVLGIHCLDMMIFWKTHKVVEVNNKENKRVA